MRQIYVRDTRNLTADHAIINVDTSTGILMPMFDPDTSMLFVAGRGDTSIHFYEVTDTHPYTTMERSRFTGEQTKGVCLVPKRALRVMETEVNRILHLTGNSLQPISYSVPRKSYLDFHSDLFPETRGTRTTGSASTWMCGSNGIVGKTSLNPTSHSTQSLVVIKSNLSARKLEEETRASQSLLEEGESYKKSIPEPRPRKKSLSSSGSSSDEVTENLGSNARPIPRPRVNNNVSNH